MHMGKGTLSLVTKFTHVAFIFVYSSLLCFYNEADISCHQLLSITVTIYYLTTATVL